MPPNCCIYAYLNLCMKIMLVSADKTAGRQLAVCRTASDYKDFTHRQQVTPFFSTKKARRKGP